MEDKKDMQNKHIPKVSIGMPVYNGERFIRKALDSLLAQTFTDFELIISDNASIDGTEGICRKYEKIDRRIRYIRQPKNMGAMWNFNFVLQEAQGEYFMWAATDDFWQPQFIEANYRILSLNREIVSSISKVRMESIARKSPKRVGTYSISGKYLNRVRKYLLCPGANSRFYGLFRREQVLNSYVSGSFIASDWAIIVNLLRYGNFYEIDQYLMERSCFGSSSNLLSSQIKQANLKWPKTIFPLLDFTKCLWANLSHKDFLKCIDLIIRLNMWLTLVLVADVIFMRKNEQDAVNKKHVSKKSFLYC